MVTLHLMLPPESCVRLHDALICLSRFSDAVCIEVRETQLNLTALNSSKSAHASIVLNARSFFSKYTYATDARYRNDNFSMSLSNKALLSIFKGRLLDVRGRETAVENCEVRVIDEPSKTECRFVAKMICRHGVTKTYRLTYGSVEIMHALFDKHRATNRWSISSRQLKDFTDYFAPKTEQLDIYSANGKMTLTSYTEKIIHGGDMLKQSLQTSISINTQDFEEFHVTDKVHVVIGVKDFRNVVAHADTLRSNVRVIYSQPTRPLQLTYECQGMLCQFTLMTIGDSPAPATSNASRSLIHDTHGAEILAKNVRNERKPVSSMLPPDINSRKMARQSERSSRATDAYPGQTHKSSSQADSRLFVSRDEDESHWDPASPHDDDHDVLGWDASATHDQSFTHLLRGSGVSLISQARPSSHVDISAIAPTQRASQVRGLFDS